MKSKLLALEYHRNGVCGTGFFAVLIQNLKDAKGKFLVTFETEENGRVEIINQTNCRVVQLEGNTYPFYKCWRGDNISYEVQTLLNELKNKQQVRDWFSLHQLFENKATGSKYTIEKVNI